jgi:curved DNA-binding protein CbpA
MGKIHTHYDNLKVARLAPQEVIRAAYKALSQKYHPDKNPGDEKAARIMAILNGAYSTLSDPQRRKEHDEWIAAEEWEIEWLESTHHEDGRGERHRGDAPPHAWSASPIAVPWVLTR